MTQSPPQTANARAATAHPEIPQDPWQYRLTADPHPGARPVGDLWLTVGDGLSVVQVLDDCGTQAGVLLGFVYDLATRTELREQWTMPAGARANANAGVQATMHALGGRFLWICLSDRGPRIYPDAAAQISCVWQAETGSAGATAHAILDDAAYTTLFDHNEFEQLDITHRGWFVGGLTAHSGVRRLLPNHYLDLQSWTAHRIGPVHSHASPASPDAVVDGLISFIQAQIEAVVENGRRAVLPLTAGYESRAILACARPWISQMSCITIASEDRQRTDHLVGTRIASAHGITHQVLPHTIAGHAEQRRFLRRAGHAIVDSNIRHHNSCHSLSGDAVLLGGLGGDIWRTPLSEDDDISDMPITSRLIMRRLGLRGTAKAHRFVQQWLNGVPTQPAEKVLSLAYLELLLAPWAMAQYCADPKIPTLAPLITHQGLALLQSIPPDWRNSNALTKAIILKAWPELDAHPYNTLGPQKDLLGKSPAIWDAADARATRLIQHRAS